MLGWASLRLVMASAQQPKSPRWRKFRRHPQRFLSDSKSSLLRIAGDFLRRHPGLEGMVRESIHDPRDIPGRFAVIPAAGSRVSAHSIDVIIPCHNNAPTIAAAVASILGQTLSPQRVIVVDDGSSDGSADILTGIAARDPRITLRRNTSNKGAAVARNIGLSMADAELVTFQDGDDWSHPRRLEWQAERLEQTGAMAVTCDGCRIADGRPVEIDGHYYHELSISVLFRRAPVLARVGYIKPMTIAEDVDYLARIRSAFGIDAVPHLQRCLYFAALREGSAIYAHGEMRRLSERSYSYVPSDETRRILNAVSSLPRNEAEIFAGFELPEDADRPVVHARLGQS